MMKRISVLVVCLLVALCATFARAESQQGDGETTVILVRHAEKADNSADPGLSARGAQRAAALAQQLSSEQLAAIFVTPLKRTADTAAPTAKARKVQPIAVKPDGGYVQRVLTEIQNQYAGKTVLVVGHSNTTSALIAALGVSDPPKIGENDYGDIYTVTIAANGSVTLKAGRFGD